MDLMAEVEMTSWKNSYSRWLVLFGAMTLSGCASFGEGVANAVLAKSEEEDTRVCQVWGEPFYGIMHDLEKQQGITKVLMTHGVGVHSPGYSTQFMEKLTTELGLTIRTRKSKDISITHPHKKGKNLGNLRVTRFFNQEKNQELLFYELTWSDITEDQKALLAFDNSGEYSFRRTKINNLMKVFANQTGPDPIIYLGDSRYDILTSFEQSFCWMSQGNWDTLPSSFAKPVCSTKSGLANQHLEHDNFVFISHSLGSRITIDGMQFIASKIEDHLEDAANDQKRMAEIQVTEAMQKKHIPIFMLSNQLPMLQLGRELPAVSSQKENYCKPGAPYYDERLLSKTSLIAFSDPNDLLSYAIPPGFSNDYLDSRLCIKVTNVNINVAKIMDVFGLGQVANPLDAHVNYDTDARVVALIAKGIGHPDSAVIVKEKCELVELID